MGRINGEKLIAGWGRQNFIWYVKIEYKEAEVLWVAITFFKKTNFWIKCILLGLNIK